MDDHFHWITKASMADLTTRLSGANPETDRLEVRVRGEKMYFRVVKAGSDTTIRTADDPPDVNDSFLCPTVCPT